MAKKAIILGGYGFLGSALAVEAAQRGWDLVRVNQAGYKDCVGMDCDLLINADGNSKKYLADEDPNLDFDLSVRSVALSLHDFHPGLYVYLSSIDVYSNKSNPAHNHEESPVETARLSRYGFHKFLAEELVRHNAKTWLILRLGGFVGPGLKKNSIYDMLKKQPIRVHPDSRYQYLDTRVMASIVFQLAESGLINTIFNLTGEGTVTIREIAGLISGQPLADAPVDKPPEHYEINISKIKAKYTLPSSRETVKRFVRDALSGAVQLS